MTQHTLRSAAAGLMLGAFVLGAGPACDEADSGAPTAYFVEPESDVELSVSPGWIEYEALIESANLNPGDIVQGWLDGWPVAEADPNGVLVYSGLNYGGNVLVVRVVSEDGEPYSHSDATDVRTVYVPHPLCEDDVDCDDGIGDSVDRCVQGRCERFFVF